MNERELIKNLIPLFKQRDEIAVGPGDDCAALDIGAGQLLLLSADQLVSGVHYDRENTSPETIARKLLNRNLSDIAAMGGEPVSALVTIAANSSDEWYMNFYKALAAETEKWDISVCGGDISSMPSLPSPVEACSLTIIGKVGADSICLRSGMDVGDVIFVTGQFGNSLASGHHLNFTPRIKEAQFLAGSYTRAMIDVSDGLLTDLLNLIDAAGTGIVIDIDKIPLRDGATTETALAEGEDYELLFAVPSDAVEDLVKEWPFKDVELTRIGTVTDDPECLIRGIDGRDLCKIYKTGFDHRNVQQNS
ncbi:MAG: thiamine-phosphate kinase [Lentisphaerae bacterium GWF2_52_8]|nr:MAG: thiamine-phosphate kinase [Lentisphaerae bacterium GWF2_52_8]